MAQKTTSKPGSKARASKRSTKTSGARPSRRVSARHGGKSAGEEEVSIDRRRNANRRREESPTAEASPQAAPQLERRQKVTRRRQIDPTTCERDYTEDEVEFMNALDDYKRRSGRMFPTCSEVLEVVRGLGYVKLPPAEFEPFRSANLGAASAKPLPDAVHEPKPEPGQQQNSEFLASPEMD